VYISDGIVIAISADDGLHCAFVWGAHTGMEVAMRNENDMVTDPTHFILQYWRVTLDDLVTCECS
jgi:hypothetical protein